MTLNLAQSLSKVIDVGTDRSAYTYSY